MDNKDKNTITKAIITLTNLSIIGALFWWLNFDTVKTFKSELPFYKSNFKLFLGIPIALFFSTSIVSMLKLLSDEPSEIVLPNYRARGLVPIALIWLVIFLSIVISIHFI